MRNKEAVVFVAIPLVEIKKFILIDIVAGTALYFAIKFPFHSLIAASAGSMFGPMIIRQSMKFMQKRDK
ncbi:MAG: hypothetical protein ACE3L7_00005 [Candidatus Pristimantibacillus sp.]